MKTFEESKARYEDWLRGQVHTITAAQMDIAGRAWHARNAELSAMQAKLDALSAELLEEQKAHNNLAAEYVKLKAAIVPGPCKESHPRMFWVEDSSELEYIDGIPVARVGGEPEHCTLCQEIDAAYQCGVADGRKDKNV